MNLVHQIPFKIPIKEILLQKGLINSFAEIVTAQKKSHIICDENTVKFLPNSNNCTILPANQKATKLVAEELAKINANSFVAVGSGTINDLVKYAAHLRDVNYIVFATDPSMNGYASGNASLLEDGYKKTFNATPPVAIYMDLDILENSPKRLINAGIGDSFCSINIARDLWLSEQVTGTSSFAEYTKLYDNLDYFENIEDLAKTLIFSGVAMLLSKSSAPASQSEHMIAHFMEQVFTNAKPSFHGEQIAVTTLTMLEIGNKLINNPFLDIKIPEFPEDKLMQLFGRERCDYFKKESAIKYAQVKETKLKHNLIAVDVGALKHKLTKVGCPTEPEHLGWDAKKYNELLPLVKFTRSRFTVLDLI